MKRLFYALPLRLPAALAAQAPPGPETIDIEFTQETLDNGLRVIYHVDRSTPMVAVDIWYNVGSKHEQPGRTGFAHLFEHMMFKGSRNVADGRHFALLEDAGAGEINGTTSWDRTNYFEQVPSHQLELALWMEADRMGTLLETLTPEKLDNQREVVKNERRQRVDNQPYGTWMGKMMTYLFPSSHPYHHEVIGSMEDLTAATTDDVSGFFRTYYAPGNAVLAIAGDFDVEQARALVRRHFGDIPAGPRPPALASMTVPDRIGQGRREVVQDANAPAPAVYVGFRMPSARDPRDNAVSLLGQMLGARSSALYDRLVRQQQIATSVGAFNLGLVDGADAFFIIAQGKPGANADSLEAALMAQLSDLAPNLSEAALERARAQQRFGFINGLQATGGFGGRADLLAMGATYFNDPGWVNRQLAESDQVTLAQLQALVRERLTPDNRVVLVYVPAAQPSTSGGN
ncbi:MAG TPA: pitrilysin family protein [Longimicrobium sp.]|nr:pitrilysin family protein [Longimicrobium sp.]